MTDIIKKYFYHPINEKSTKFFRESGHGFFEIWELLIFSSAIYTSYLQ